jgi:hypothetical protein
VVKLASFRDIVDNPESVEVTETPFQYVNVDGSLNGDHGYKWSDDNTLILKDRDIWHNKGGRIYLIVKSEYEVRMKMSARRWQYFNLGSLSQTSLNAYNISYSAPFITGWGGWDSTVTFTLRGGSMLGVTTNGDGGVWDKQGTFFHQETVARGITQPNDGSVTKVPAILMNFTAPFSDYSSQDTYTIMIGENSGTTSSQDLKVQLLGYSKNEGEIINGVFVGDTIVGTIGDVVDSDPRQPEYNTAEWSKTYLVKKGVDDYGEAWSIEVKERQSDGMWFVVVDGVLEQSYADYDDALKAARDRVESRVQQGQNVVTNDDDPKDWLKIGAIGGIAGIGLLILILVLKR